MKYVIGLLLIVVLLLFTEIAWLSVVRVYDSRQRHEALKRGDICVVDTMRNALDPWTVWRFSKVRYKKPVRWDLGEYGHGCTCPGSFGMLTADPEACK